MGCDGGTIPRRDELVKTKKKPEQKDKKAELAFRWKHCAASQEPLQNPVVACELGRMYNKDTVIETLLDRSKTSEIVAHLRTLKDVKELKFTENPDWDADAVDANIKDDNKSQWICPISGQMMNGLFRFSFLWTCGCVMSERAIKEVTKNGNGKGPQECLKCQKPYTADDVILLNPSDDEEIDSAHSRMEARREKVRAEKKSKKQKSVVASITVVACEETSSSSSGDDNKKKEMPKSETLKLDSKKRVEQVKAGPSEKKTRLMSTPNGLADKALLNSKSASSASSAAKSLANYTVAKDPKASDVYKSLFTSHPDAQKQDRAHWVTYNPFYN